MAEQSWIASHLQAPYLSMQSFLRPAHWQMPEHAHPFYQIIYVTEGVLQAFCGAETLYISQGQAHILPPGCPHRLSSPKGYRQLGLDVDPASTIRDIPQLLKDYVPSPTVISCPEALNDVFQLLVPAPLSRLEQARRTALLDHLIFRLLSAHAGDSACRFDLRLSEYLSEHLHEPFSLEKIAAAFFMSVPQLERMSRQHFGSSVMQLYHQRRLMEAKALLLSSGKSISAIAEQLSFCDAAHFCHFFKSRCGLSPARYRRLSQDSGDDRFFPSR